ncbi:MAG: ribbon-helix-helix domain-containing protein [Actinomycetota bacterium]|nr:ribbon-helix-helix domain-containing protein [Actinomycetota bacterium]
MRKTTVYLPDETEQRMRRAAARLGISRAQITRAALEQFLERAERRDVLPPSVGMGENSATAAADYEDRLARYWSGAPRR